MAAGRASTRLLSSDRSSQRGFSLIELLIVVVIIAVLAAILIPNFFRTRASAQVAASKSNLRNLATALATYQAAKGGLLMLTRGMALELAPLGIRVNAIAPGFTLTEMNRDLWSDAGVLAARTSQVPLGRPGTPGDHAGAAVLLASDESAFMTGTSIVVDGGITTR